MIERGLSESILESHYLRRDKTCVLQAGISERGVILLVFPIVLLFILFIIGLAIDSGRIYHTRLDAQSAADAAVLSAIGARAGEGDPDFVTFSGNNNTYIEQRAREALISNGERRGISEQANSNNPNFTRYFKDSTVTISENIRNRALAVQVNAEIHVPTLILGNLSSFIVKGGVSDNSFLMNNTVSISARSELLPANVVFIADLSQSSRCPEIGSCECNKGSTISCSAEAAAFGPNVRLKYQRIEEAFSKFIDTFDPTRDRIALIFFNNFAWVEVGFQNVPQNAPKFDPGALRAAFASITEDQVKGNTNISDGLITALEHADAAVSLGLLAPNDRVQYVLLTDGAPTAMRVVNNDNEDVLNLDLIWQKNPPNPVDPFYHGPGHFIKTADYSLKPEHRFLAPLTPNDVAGPDYYPTSMLAKCSKSNPERVWSETDSERDAAANNCAWGTFTLPIPNCNSCQFTATPVTKATLNMKNGQYKDAYYHAAIQASQAIRDRRGRIYTIGWGPEAADPALDPYQQIIDGMNVKTGLLANIANDRYRFGPGGFAEYSFPDYKHVADRFKNPNKELAGGFYNPKDAAELGTAMEGVARQIKIQLIKTEKVTPAP